MEDLKDDPIIDSILRTGYPPWMQGWEDDEEWEDEDPDVFYGNSTQDF